MNFICEIEKVNESVVFGSNSELEIKMKLLSMRRRSFGFSYIYSFFLFWFCFERGIKLISGFYYLVGI